MAIPVVCAERPGYGGRVLQVAAYLLHDAPVLVPHIPVMPKLLAHRCVTKERVYALRRHPGKQAPASADNDSLDTESNHTGWQCKCFFILRYNCRAGDESRILHRRRTLAVEVSCVDRSG